ncbi:MAG: PAS domain S-box protein [Candidatus Lokiarchaeota archaeon]|nr:PAS domain S-box protein [Candidatus Lokiarchaeota archaeon]
MSGEKKKAKSNDDSYIGPNELKTILFNNVLVGLGAARGSDGQMIITNDCLSEIFGYESPSEFLEEFKTTEMWKNPVSRQHMYNAMKEQGHVDGFEAELLRKDGSSFWARWAGKLIPGTNLLAGAVIDISKEKELLTSLQSIERKYTALIDSKLIGIQIVKTKPLNIQFVNSTVYSITGYSQEELQTLVNSGILSIIHPDDRERISKIFTESVEDFKGSSYDFRLKRKDGEWIWVRNQISLIEYDPRPTYMVTLIDITSEIEARECRAQLQEAELYAGILTHDLGNDIQTIMSFIDIAEMDIPKDNPVLVKAFQSVNNAIDRMQYLLKAFKLDGSCVSKKISKILTHVVEETSTTYPSLSIDLHINKSAQNSEVRKRQLLPLVFENLIRNTIEASGPSAHISISLDKRNDILEILYFDNGSETAQHLQSTLFKRGTTSSSFGFGLNLARKIVTGYGGSIEFVAPGVKKKTGVRIQLPISK